MSLFKRFCDLVDIIRFQRPRSPPGRNAYAMKERSTFGAVSAGLRLLRGRLRADALRAPGRPTA
jgi:hypothetical protein